MWIHFEYQVICMCDVIVSFTFGDKLSCLYFVSAKACRCWFTSCGLMLWVIENSLLVLPRNSGGYVSSGIHLLLFGFLLNSVEGWCIGQGRIHYIVVWVLIKWQILFFKTFFKVFNIFIYYQTIHLLSMALPMIFHNSNDKSGSTTKSVIWTFRTGEQ